MAWIESHQALRDHPKTRKLCRILRISRAQAVGHLQFLWWWAVDYADDGDLSRCETEDIALGADWEGEPEEFVDALVKATGPSGHGFVDRDENGGMWLHDWDHYTGRLVTYRKGEAIRQAYNRAKLKPADKLTPDDLAKIALYEQLKAQREGVRRTSGRTSYGTDRPTDLPTTAPEVRELEARLRAERGIPEDEE